jgi:hypothetical protein
MSFNGVQDSYFGLTMSGNTPLLVPKPKRSTLEVSYANGTIDSSELYGELFFEDLNLEYTLVRTLSTAGKDTMQMNSWCSQLIEQITSWVYSGPALLEDDGLPRDLPNADCSSLEITKTIANDYWALKVTVSFKAPFNMPLNDYSYHYIPYRGERFIVFNGASSLDKGLIMVGNTPVVSKHSKTSEYAWPTGNGSLNLSHANKTYHIGEQSIFYQDNSIQYRFIQILSKKKIGGEYTTKEMDLNANLAIENICTWLYKHSSLSFVTIDGQIAYGGLELALVDSAWATNPREGATVPCLLLPSSRVTALEFGKSMYPECWILTVSVTFTTYPKFFDGSLTIPIRTSPNPQPSVTVDTWKHYAEFKTQEVNSDIFMIQYDSNNAYVEPGIYIGIDTNVLPYDFIEEDETGTPAQSGKYILDGQDISVYFSVEVPEYIHSSMANYPVTKGWTPRIIIDLPAVLSITVGNETVLYYKSDFETNITPGNYVKYNDYCYVDSDEMFEEDKLKDNPAGIIFGGFNPSGLFYATYTPISNEGVIGEGGFDAEELGALDYISINVKVHYILRISGDDVISSYGLTGDDAELTPNPYYIYNTNLFDYTGSEPSFSYETDSIIPYNFSQTGDVVQFLSPGHYTGHHDNNGGYGRQVKLRIPLVNNTSNNYILCDRKKPSGGDIQWQ